MSAEEGEQFSRKHNLFFFEVSAKTGEKVNEAFLKLTEIVLNKIENGEVNPANEVPGFESGIQLSSKRRSESRRATGTRRRFRARGS